MDWTRYRKLGAALAGVLAQAVAAGIVPADWAPWAQVLLALATAWGVWRLPNNVTSRDENVIT